MHALGKRDTEDMNYNLFNDRRKFLRKPYKAQVLLKFSEIIKGRGYMKDIGISGACIISPDPFAFYRPEQADIFLDKKMLVSLPSENLTIKGTIVRIDTVKNELAIVISHTSDNEKWRKLSK